MRRRTPAFRGAAIVLCVSLTVNITPTSAWTSRPTVNHRSPQRTDQSRLFSRTDDGGGAPLSTTASKPVNPNPHTQKRKSQASRNKVDLATSSASISAAERNSRQQARRRKRKTATPVESQRLELLNHEIISREEELDLGKKVVRANQLRFSMASLIEDKKAALQHEILKEVYRNELSNEAFLALTENQFDSLDLEDLTHFPVVSTEDELFDPDGMPILSGEDISLDNHFQNQHERGISCVDEWDDRLLTDDDIVRGLGLPGGRAELQRILLEGAFARDRLIRNNVRLVVSIAKRWARQSAKFSNEDGARLVSIYAGNAYRPSLDEAIQEGILGLARAADRYDPSRGFRFSTYATYWVTNFVRICFREASTGSLRIPSKLHELKVRRRHVWSACLSYEMLCSFHAL